MEILAPAGNMSALKAAIANGANAVYLGFGNFNARQKADNFNEENIQQVVNFAHLFSVKVYVAMNTLIKPKEMAEVLRLVKVADDANVDAIIVQDLGLLTEIKRTMPHIVLHSSTQMGVHNVYGAIAAEKLGVSRVILSREVTISDIKQIHERTNLEIEVFVHGALCVAFSGNCYFSSLVSGYSGNRGKCLQLCRKEYINEHGQKAYHLSSKDLCLAAKLNLLKDAGVCSVKIEGRMRSSEYVATTVKTYKNALLGKYTNIDLDNLKSVFNRGDYTDGHLFSSTNNTIFANTQSNIGLCVGNVSKIINDIAYLNLKHSLNKGDGVKYLRHGYEVGAGLITNENSTTTFKGDVKSGDEVRLTSKNILEVDYEKQCKIEITASAKFKRGFEPSLQLNYNNISITATGAEAVKTAQLRPLLKEDILRQISKFGETHFIISQIDIEVDENIFYQISEINALRRNAAQLLQEKILSEYAKSRHIISTMPNIVRYNWLQLEDKSHKFIQIDSYTANTDTSNYDYIILNPSEYTLENAINFYNLYGDKAILSLPIIARDTDLKLLKDIVDNSGIKLFVANNLYALELCKDKIIIAGTGMNMLNDFYNCTYIQSIESENYIFSKNKIIFTIGNIPLMHFTHCPKKVSGGNCNSCSGYNINYTDTNNNIFKLRRVKIANCYSQLINCVRTDISLEISKLDKSNTLIDVSSDNNEIISQKTRGNFGKTLY